MGTAFPLSNMKDNWWSVLPFDLQNVKVTLGSRPVGFRYSSFIFNIEAVLDGMKIVSCGEDKSSELAITKALVELTERSSMLKWSKDIPNQRRTSSGWAAHQTEFECKQAAVLELVERDAVLAQWYSATPFIKIETNTLPESIRSWVKNELGLSEFSQFHLLLSTEGIGPSVTCIFTNEEGFGVSGHATKSTLLDSIESALAEACRAAHLAIRKSFWEDSIALKNSYPKQVDPGAHAVYYAYHEAFPRWMFGEELDWRNANQIWDQRFSNLDLDVFQFEVVLTEPWVVGFASHPEILELIWGPTNEIEIAMKMQNRVFSDPCKPKNLNLKPHIVS